MMNVNSEKMTRYGEFTIHYKKYNGKVPIVHFFTLKEYRQKTLEQLAAKNDVYAKVHVLTEF